MNKEFILKKRKDFLRVAEGVHAATSTVVLQAAPSLSQDPSHYKVGFTTTKKIGKAHIRNRARRKMRAAAREVFPGFGKNNIDYVMIGRLDTASCSFKNLCKDLKWAIKKTHRLLDEAQQKQSEKMLTNQNSKNLTNKKTEQKSGLAFFFILIVKFYQKFISPLCPGCCRFRPSCSQYMIEALQNHGLIKGSYLGIKRILRCHPWGDCGNDPVPPATQTKTKKKNS